MIKLQLSTNQQRLLVQLVSGLPVLDPILGPWVAGGAVRAVVAYEDLNEVRDVDVFFASLTQRKQFEDRLVELGYKLEWAGVVGTKSYLTQWGKLIQIVTGRFVPSAVDLVSDFSITACQFVTDGHHVWASGAAMQDAINRRFVLNNPGRLSERFVTKYLTDYGYTYDGDVDALMSMDFGQWYSENDGGSEEVEL